MLLAARGVNLAMWVLLSSEWPWPLIQPWQSASSSASLRLREVGSLVPFFARVSATPGEVAAWARSQLAQAEALGTVSRSRCFIVESI